MISDQWNSFICHKLLLLCLQGCYSRRVLCLESSCDGERPITAWLLRLTPTTKRLPGKGIGWDVTCKTWLPTRSSGAKKHLPEEPKPLALSCHRFFFEPTNLTRGKTKSTPPGIRSSGLISVKSISAGLKAGAKLLCVWWLALERHVV